MLTVDTRTSRLRERLFKVVRLIHIVAEPVRMSCRQKANRGRTRGQNL
jgi:hypothetical protein